MPGLRAPALASHCMWAALREGVALAGWLPRAEGRAQGQSYQSPSSAGDSGQCLTASTLLTIAVALRKGTSEEGTGLGFSPSPPVSHIRPRHM